jgi:hypothetical protein
MRFSTALVLLPLWLLVACGPAGTDGNNNASDGGHHLPDGYVGPDAGDNNNTNNNNEWQPPTNSRVYVNTETTLYYIDPGVSEELVTIGDFAGDCTADSGFYDIAVDEQGNLLGIAAEGLYTVDTETADCTRVFQFPPDPPHFFSLSYVKGVDPAEPDVDKLVAASAEDGEWVWINWPAENLPDIFIHLGYYDHPDYQWRSSGDIVSIQVDVATYVTYATLRCGNYTDPGCTSDWLAEVDPETGDARIIGETGYQRIFGLGFWGDRLYGFTGDGEYIHIDVDTGVGTLVQEFTGQTFWGAGNTTIPHIVE